MKVALFWVVALCGLLPVCMALQPRRQPSSEVQNVTGFSLDNIQEYNFNTKVQIDFCVLGGYTRAVLVAIIRMKLF
jgi:hypothetical protein